MVEEVKKLEHLAIIMDGNRRWARQNGKTIKEGHSEGAKRLGDAMDWCIEYGIKFLSVFAFSTENWKRDIKEVNDIMSLLRHYLKSNREDFLKKDIKIKWIGSENGVDKDIVEDIRKLEKETENNKTLQVNVAFNYGGRLEIVDTTKKIAQQVKEGVLDIKDINENIFQKNLYYGSNVPDPDLIIRTGGNYRISNFLLWEMAYSEFYFTDTFWPTFDKKLFGDIINNFTKRVRTYGGTK